MNMSRSTWNKFLKRSCGSNPKFCVKRDHESMMPRTEAAYKLNFLLHNMHALPCPLLCLPRAGSKVKRIEPIPFPVWRRRRRLNQALSVLPVLAWVSFECVLCCWLGFCVFCLFVILIRLSVPVQMIDWLERLLSELTYDVLMETLNPILTDCLIFLILGSFLHIYIALFCCILFSEVTAIWHYIN